MKLRNSVDSAKALRAAKIGVFAALYAATSLVPISMFIGAPSFLALNLVITPIIAMLLMPVEAFLTSLFGGLIAFYISPSQAMFGPYTILLPVMGATFGSLAFHKNKSGAFLTTLFLATTILAYLVKNYPFPYFIAPHSVALAIVLISSFRSMTPLRVKIPIFAFVATMSEQGMMMVFAVHLLNLPWQVFTGILPLMLYERIVATIGGTLIILALKKAIPKFFAKVSQ